MVYSIAPYPRFRAYYPGTSTPLVGGQLYTVLPGTTVDPANYKDTYTDSTGAANNTNPIILDANGEADVWLDDYTKLVLYDALGNLIWTHDNVSSMPNTSAFDGYPNTIGVGSDGQSLTIKTVSTLLTIAANTVTSTWTGAIPAGATVFAVPSRVKVVLPANATAYSVGISGFTTRYTNAASNAANTTDKGMLDAMRYYANATDILVTTTGTPTTATGRIRLAVQYLDVTPPTG
jgi:hypothetical protein